MKYPTDSVHIMTRLNKSIFLYYIVGLTFQEGQMFGQFWVRHAREMPVQVLTALKQLQESCGQDHESC